MAAVTVERKKFETPTLEKLAMMLKSKTMAPVTHSIIEGEEALSVKCSKCNIFMDKISEYTLSCTKCTESMDIGNTGECTIGSGDLCGMGHTQSFRPTGGAAARKLCFAMTKATSDGEAFRNLGVLDMLKKFNALNRKNFDIPLDVLIDAQETFIKLKDHDFVTRGKARRGKLGACIFVSCQRAMIAKTQSQIATMMDVEESKISSGLATLQQFHESKVIQIPQNRDPMPDYLTARFEIFDIKREYLGFAKELLERAVKKRIAGIATCFIPSRCIGVIYGLNVWLNLGISHERISSECEKISRNTYQNVFRAIENNEVLLRKVFIKHNIPMPASWARSVGAGA